jgi:hypothetical protein
MNANICIWEKSTSAIIKVRKMKTGSMFLLLRHNVCISPGNCKRKSDHQNESQFCMEEPYSKILFGGALFQKSDGKVTTLLYPQQEV